MTAFNPVMPSCIDGVFSQLASVAGALAKARPASFDRISEAI